MQKVQKVVFKEFETPNKKIETQNNLNILQDIDTPLSMILGNTSLTIGELSNLKIGSLIPLKKDPSKMFVDITLNDGSIIGQGEIVIVNNEKVYIRVVNIGKENTKSS